MESVCLNIDFGLRNSDCGFPIAALYLFYALTLCPYLFALTSLPFASSIRNPKSAFRIPQSLHSFALKDHVARVGSRGHDGKDVFFLFHHDINYGDAIMSEARFQHLR